MWRRAIAAWVAAVLCGCSFEALDIRLTVRDGAVDVSAPDAPPPPPDVAADAPTAGQRSCTPTRVVGCGQARIVGGSFVMGDPEAYDNGGPMSRATPIQPSIRVSTFMFDRYEVTVARFRRFVDDQRPREGERYLRRDPADPIARHCNWTTQARTPDDREGHPMNCVDWEIASAFCRWDTIGGTLPSEAQWEYAARGSMNRPWPWEGPDSAMPDGRVCWNRFSPTPLGTCLEEDMTYAAGATPDGVRHLVGNVWEWTADLYAPFNDAVCWNQAARRNPTCMNNVDGYCSMRGGSWINVGAPYVRSGARSVYPPSVGSGLVGFRCAGTDR